MTIDSSSKEKVILVCIDNNISSDLTLKYARYKARITGLTVKIMTVLDPYYKKMLFLSKIVSELQKEEIEQHFQDAINSIYKQVDSRPSFCIREGNVCR